MKWSMEAISEEMAMRRTSMSPALERMLEVRDRYNADVVVPVPDTDDDLPYDSLAPLLIADAVDHPAMYAVQAAPTIFVPAVQPGKTTGVRSTQYAAKRRKALYNRWDKSWWEMVLGRFYRHLGGYAVSALVVELGMDGPTFATRDPLSSYPEPKAPEDLSMPSNVGFISGKSIDWLYANYPQTRDRFPRGEGWTSASDDAELWDIVEWMDDEEIVLGVLGPRNAIRSWTEEPRRWSYELDRYPNVIGRCPAVIPRRVTLDRVISQLANLTGHVDLMARLMYLDIRATEKSIFPDRYVVSKVGQNPRLADGTWHGGETGLTNLILDADAVGELRGTPDPNNKVSIDRVERNFRVSSGLVPQTGGETYGALRTGRGIDSLMGAALDPRTAELHHIAERYLTEVNELMLLAYKNQYGSRTFHVFSTLDPASDEFTPNEHIEVVNGKPFVENRVYYPIPGMDDINATQVIGQMMGANLISKRDGRRMHPHINNPEGTEQQLLVEQMEEITMMSLLQRAQNPPGIPPTDIARMNQLLTEGKSLTEAVMQVDREASERQAAAPPDPMSPEAMPGLANPGEGAEQGGMVSAQGTPLEQFRSLVGALRSTTPGGGPPRA